MSTWTEMSAKASAVLQAHHGFDVTIQKSDGSQTDQTVTAWDALGEQLGAVDVHSERNLIVVTADLAWSPIEGDYMVPSDDSDTYTVLKVAARTNGTLRLQGWKPVEVT